MSPYPRALSGQMEPFDRDDFAPWLGAVATAMPGIAEQAQRRHGAKAPRPQVAQIGPSGALRRLGDGFTSRAVPRLPEGQICTIKLFLFGRNVL